MNILQARQVLTCGICGGKRGLVTTWRTDDVGSMSLLTQKLENTFSSIKSKSKLESLQGLKIECQRRHSLFLSLSLSIRCWSPLIFMFFVVVPPGLFCSSAPMSPYYYNMILWYMFMTCL
jgi:hypothetical protein